MGSELFEEFLMQVGAHQGYMLSPLISAIVMNVITENATEGLINKILFADDLVLMSGYLENLRKKILKWKKAFDSKELKVNLEKIKVIVSGLKEEILKSSVDPCAKCGKRVRANSMLAQIVVNGFMAPVSQ